MSNINQTRSCVPFLVFSHHVSCTFFIFFQILQTVLGLLLLASDGSVLLLAHSFLRENASPREHVRYLCHADNLRARRVHDFAT